jgi:prenyl protein peptidase
MAFKTKKRGKKRGSKVKKKNGWILLEECCLNLLLECYDAREKQNKTKTSRMGSFVVDPNAAVCACIGILVSFVGLLYVSSSGRKDRDSDEAIKARFVSVFAACIVSGLVVWAILPSRSFWSEVGVLIPRGLVRALLPVLATLVLFLGPLVQWYLSDPDDWSLTQVSRSLRRAKLIAARNFVVAPICEEWAFRACMCPLLRAAGFSFLQCVVIPPLLFGVAHAHHVVLMLRGRSLASVVATVVFQVFYTTLFGSMASFFFLVSGSIVGPIISHSFCNMMGFPDMLGAKQHQHKWILFALYLFGLVWFYFLMNYMFDVTIMLEFIDASSPSSTIFAPPQKIEIK